MSECVCAHVMCVCVCVSVNTHPSSDPDLLHHDQVVRYSGGLSVTEGLEDL